MAKKEKPEKGKEKGEGKDIVVGVQSSKLGVTQK